ncbi:hypothetical protein CEXT_110921 [Caerostris extrusa]|uniref:Secreted protein n=1 Tax=Caerostris extrusa TaxID=172846 RepID=A0AAV4VMU9_CAEEX|nr:hypothetical protein CEXT_110921 [Caerostris extrusa]
MHVTRKLLVYRILYHSFNKLCSETSSHTYPLPNCNETCDANNLRFNSSLLDVLNRQGCDGESRTTLPWRRSDAHSHGWHVFIGSSTGCYPLLNTQSVKCYSWCLCLLGGVRNEGD